MVGNHVLMHGNFVIIGFLSLFTILCSPFFFRSDALDKFAVLNIQLQNLSVQLRPLLQHYAIHPRSVNQTNAPILPIMLATKLLPEQEAEQQAMLADGLAPADAQECLKATAELAALIDSITQNGGPLDPKGPLRAKLAASVKSATNLEQEKKPVGPPATGLSGTQPVFGAVGQPQAPSPLEGADLLLAAASYGAGL